MTRGRGAELLRQERETFDQLKVHDALWFKLRLATGFAAIVTLLAILVIAGSVVVAPSHYSDAAVTIAAIALLADIAGIAGAVFSLVLRDKRDQLRPVVGRDNK